MKKQPQLTRESFLYFEEKPKIVTGSIFKLSDYKTIYDYLESDYGNQILFYTELEWELILSIILSRYDVIGKSDADKIENDKSKGIESFLAPLKASVNKEIDTSIFTYYFHSSDKIIVLTRSSIFKSFEIIPYDHLTECRIIMYPKDYDSRFEKG